MENQTDMVLAYLTAIQKMQHDVQLEPRIIQNLENIDVQIARILQNMRHVGEIIGKDKLSQADCTLYMTIFHKQIN